jgi:hypothetical protein
LNTKAILILGVLAVLFVSVAGCTSPSSTSTTNNAQAYAKAFATDIGENSTVIQTTIVANGSDGAQLTLILAHNGTTNTCAFNIQQFSSVASATAFYNSQSFGYAQVSNGKGTLYPSVYSSVMGHNATINKAAATFSSSTNISYVFQQDEFVTWGTVSL